MIYIIIYIVGVIVSYYTLQKFLKRLGITDDIESTKDRILKIILNLCSWASVMVLVAFLCILPKKKN